MPAICETIFQGDDGETGTLLIIFDDGMGGMLKTDVRELAGAIRQFVAAHVDGKVMHKREVAYMEGSEVRVQGSELESVRDAYGQAYRLTGPGEFEPLDKPANNAERIHREIHGNPTDHRVGGADDAAEVGRRPAVRRRQT